MLFTKQGQGIRFAESEVRPMGRASQGVIGIKLRDGDEVVGAAIADEAEDVLLLTTGGFGKRTKLTDFPVKHRAGLGVKAIKIVSTRGTLATARAVMPTDEIVVTSSDGIMIRQSVKDINRYGRNSMGVKVMNLAGGATLSALAVAQTINGAEEA
jgi:DNA gyrase subunit A